MKKTLETVWDKVNNRFAVVATTGSLVAAGSASAQTTTNTMPILDLTSSFNSFGQYMNSVITTNAPALFVILALAVGFYFLWGRARSLF